MKPVESRSIVESSTFTVARRSLPASDDYSFFPMPDRRCTLNKKNTYFLPSDSFSHLKIYIIIINYHFYYIYLASKLLLIIIDPQIYEPKRSKSRLEKKWNFQFVRFPNKYKTILDTVVRGFSVGSQRIDPAFHRVSKLRPLACPFIHLPVAYIFRPSGS